jgi:FkbM family methyltransferase
MSPLRIIPGFIHFMEFILQHPLNSQNRLKAIYRYILWQLGSRLVPGPVVVSFVNDAKLMVSPGMKGATVNIYTGLHEFEDMSFVLHTLRKGDVFVDVGANIGSYTVLAGAVVGAKCIAFEPILKTYLHLLQNIKLNGINELAEVYNVGVGKEHGVLEFTKGYDAINHVVSPNDHDSETVKVPVKMLDDLLEGVNPTLIKIDVEGYETNVVKGAHEVLSKNSLLAVIMEMNGSGERYGFDETALHHRMLDYGFQTFTYSPFERELISLNGKKNSKSGNTLYIRDVSCTLTRVKAACDFHVLGHTI